MISEFEVSNIVQNAVLETGKTANDLTNEELLAVIAKSIYWALRNNKDSVQNDTMDRIRSRGTK